jgi:hypothetical protein
VLRPPRPLVDDLVGRAGARRVTTILSGDYLEIPVAQEADLISVLTGYGHTAVRDDDLVRRLGRSRPSRLAPLAWLLQGVAVCPQM